MNKKKVKKFYENYHKDKILNPVVQFMFREKQELLKKLLKQSSGRILIIGCGSENEMEIINKNCKGTGIDISEKAINISKKNYPNFEYHVADATNLPFPDNNFDHIVCSEVIEHIPEDAKVLSEIRRTLKPGGTFIITTPNWISWYGLARKTAETLFKKPFTSGDQPIDNWSTPGNLRKKLKKYDFKIKKFRGIWYYPPFGKGTKQLPPKMAFIIVKVLYPFEFIFRRLFPWFGHMILFQSKLNKK